MDAGAGGQILKFGAFELDVAAGELRKGGRLVHLRPQAFRLLLLLVRKPGVLVTRDEIRRELWPDDTFVDFDQGVNFAVKQIREALGDSAEAPLYILTVPRRGYRFIAPLLPAGDAPLPSFRGTDLRLHRVLWQNIAELRLADRRRRNTTIAVGLLGLLVLLGILALLLRC